MPGRFALALSLVALLSAAALAEDGETLIAGIGRAVHAQAASRAQSRSAIQAAMDEYDGHAAALNAAFDRVPADPRDKKWVALKLRHMAELDGTERQFNIETPGRLHFTEAEKDEFRQRIAPRAKAIGESNIADMKSLLRLYPWFKISEFGEQADKDAWYLIQHADADPEFQSSVLDVLGRMAAAKETNPKNYAFLYDRVAISYENPSRRKPQRYGTQGECAGPGRWQVILPVEDPPRLDERRKEMGLGPEAEYQKTIEEKLCR